MKVDVTFYYANWCGHCMEFKPIYNENNERVNNTAPPPPGLEAVPEEQTKFRLPQDCNFKTNSYTRLDNPSSNLRGTGINRWEWLCRNPQSNVFIPFRNNLNTRLIMKDMYSGGSSAKTDICDTKITQLLPQNQQPQQM